MDEVAFRSSYIFLHHAFLAILGVPKMALVVPETKNGDHFYRPNYPPKPRKNHILATQNWYFGHFTHFCFVFESEWDFPQIL